MMGGDSSVFGPEISPNLNRPSGIREHQWSESISFSDPFLRRGKMRMKAVYPRMADPNASQLFN